MIKCKYSINTLTDTVDGYMDGKQNKKAYTKKAHNEHKYMRRHK